MNIAILVLPFARVTPIGMVRLVIIIILLAGWWENSVVLISSGKPNTSWCFQPDQISFTPTLATVRCQLSTPTKTELSHNLDFHSSLSTFHVHIAQRTLVLTNFFRSKY